MGFRTNIFLFGFFTITLTTIYAEENTTGINVVTILEPPFVMRDQKTGIYSGLMIDVLEAAGIPIDHYETPMQDLYGGEANPGQFVGAIGDLIDGKYDLAVAPFSIRSQRAKLVTFTQPVIHNGYMVLYKIPKTEWNINTNSMATLIKPFSPGLWCLIIVMSLVVSTALYLIRRLSPYEDDVTNLSSQKGDNSRAAMSWGNGLMYLLSSLFCRNASAPPRSTSGRILTSVWWLFSLMTVGAYVAGLVVILFKAKPHMRTLPFASVDEMLAQTDVKVLGVKHSSTYKYMSEHHGYYERKIYKYWKHNWDSVMVDTFQEGLKLLEEGDGKYALFMDEALADYLASQEPCDKMVIGEPVGDQTFGFACPKGSKVCDDMNHAILQLQESGKMEKLREKWFWSGCHMSSELYYEGMAFFDTFGGKEPGLLSPNSITIKRFSAAFIIMLIGFVLAIVVLVVECLYWRRVGNIHHRLKSVVRSEDAQGIQEAQYSPEA